MEIRKYVDETILNEVVSLKADKTDIPSLDGYATEAFVTEALANTVTMEQVNAAISSAINDIQFQAFYTGDTIPDNSIGNDGDLYLVRG